MQWSLPALESIIRKVVWELLIHRIDSVQAELRTFRDNFKVEYRSALSDLTALTARVATLEAEVAALQASASIPETATCPMAAVVGDIVYQTGDPDVVDLADASDPAKMPAVWMIARKPSSTTCVLQKEGPLGGMSGLTPGAFYYADPARPGKWVTPAPAHVDGQVGQQVCIATSSWSIDITIALEPPVYY